VLTNRDSKGSMTLWRSLRQSLIFKVQGGGARSADARSSLAPLRVTALSREIPIAFRNGV